jgi:hypothetical protein
LLFDGTDSIDTDIELLIPPAPLLLPKALVVPCGAPKALVVAAGWPKALVV